MIYHIRVEIGEDGWLVGQAMEEPAALTQGKDLDELAVMIRDALELLTGKGDFQIDVMLPAALKLAHA
jgi:predicted RNase H-like HicB family nuclease